MPVMLHMLLQAALGVWAARWHHRIAGSAAQHTAPYALAAASLAAALWLVPATTAQYLVAPDYAWSYLIDPAPAPLPLGPSSALAAVLQMLVVALGFRVGVACVHRPKVLGAVASGGAAALALMVGGLGLEPLVHMGSYEQYWAQQAPALHQQPWLALVALAYGLWLVTYRALTLKMVRWLA